MKTIRTYQNPGEAGFAQSLLEAHGLAAALIDEGGAAAIPTGMVSIRLQVPEEEAAEAEQLLAQHPVSFTQREEERRYLGFWWGCLCTIAALAGALFLIDVGGGGWRITIVGALLIVFAGGLVGANLPLSAKAKK